jgi:hypothetical protein
MSALHIRPGRAGIWLTRGIFAGCIAAAVVVTLPLWSYGGEKSTPGRLTFTPVPPQMSQELREKLLQEQQHLRTEGRYLEPDYLYPQAEPPQATTFLLPPWEVGRSATRVIPNYHAGMAASVLIAPETASTAPHASRAPASGGYRLPAKPIEQAR